MKTLVAFLSFLAALPVLSQVPPATVTRHLTNGGTTLTVNFTLHPIRSPNYGVTVQDAGGALAAHAADVPRTYLGTVEGRPGAIAAGYQKASGAFWSFVVFEDGKTWSSTGTSASAGGGNWTPNVFPTTGVGSGGAGPAVRAAELGVDASYREYVAVGSNVTAAIDQIEFSVMKANLLYLRDLALIHRLGRLVIRSSAAHCPYEAMPHATVSDWSALLNTMKTQWNSVLPASTHDVALMVKPGIGGGLAWVGAIGTSNRYSVNGASSGDFSNVWRHEVGHNWGSSHYEGGGKPEGPTIMSDNSLARISSPEAAKMISHRNSKNAILDNLGAYPFPLPPRAFGDRATMAAGPLFQTIDVLANDSDSNGEAIALHSSDSASTLRALVVRSAGTGPSGRDQLIYYAPPRYTSGYDHFDYRIQDAGGQQGIAKVYVNPVKLPALPPLWVSSDIGIVGTSGDAGGESGGYVVYGAGEDIWGTADEFRFVRQAATGDCDLRARVTGQAATEPWAKAGVMLRDGTAADAAHASVFATPSNGFAFQYRTSAGTATGHMGGPALNAGPDNWVRLTRSGDLFTAYVSADGTAWTQVGTATIPMAATIQAGLAATSHIDTAPGGAAFDRVSLRHAEPLAMLVDDGFDGTAGNDETEPLDVAWLSNGTLSTAADATLGGGNALNVDGNTYADMKAAFAGRALANTGDMLRLSFDFRYTQTPGSTGGGFRFGLFNGGGNGYSVQHGTGGSTYHALMKDDGGDGSFGFGGLTALATGSKASLNDQAKHTAVLTLEKTAAGIRVTSAVDGVNLTGDDGSEPVTAFDTVLISNGNITGDYRVDNLRVEAIQLAPPAFAADPFAKPAAAIGLAYAGSLAADMAVPHPANTFEKTSGPAWLTVAADGTLGGTPAEENAGANSFGVRATDGAGRTVEATITVPVAWPVTLAATAPTASEEDLSPGTVAFTRSGPTTEDLTIHFTVSGTAAAGEDFVPPVSPVTIPASQASTAVAIVPLDDALLEPAETIVLTLLPSPDYAAGASSSATVTLLDDEGLFVRVSDGFDSEAATPGDDGDDPFDTAWTGSGASLSIATDATLGTGMALHVDVTSSFSGARGSFASRSLPAAGDSITLSFDFRFTAAPGNVAGGIRFGLYDAAGAGFCVQHGTGGSTALGLVEAASGSFGSGPNAVSFFTANKATINDQAKHTMSLKLTRTAGGLLAASTVDGVVHAATKASPVITAFDTVFIANGNHFADFRIDNVRVEAIANRAPFFVSQPLSKPPGTLGEPYAGSLAGDAADPNEGDQPSFAKVAGPAWLTVAADGTLGGIPDSAGPNSFTVRATDPHGLSSDATLLIEVSDPLPPIEAWRLAVFGENSGIAANDDDADGDGLVNLVEYALGLDPEAFSPPFVPAREKGLLSLTYTVNLAATDATVTPQWSGDLAAWHGEGVTVQVLGESGGIRTVKAGIPASGQAKFLRLLVTTP